LKQQWSNQLLTILKIFKTKVQEVWINLCKVIYICSWLLQHRLRIRVSTSLVNESTLNLR